jgi:hypothetical protein
MRAMVLPGRLDQAEGKTAQHRFDGDERSVIKRRSDK